MFNFFLELVNTGSISVACVKASDTRASLTEVFTELLILMADRHVGFHKRFFKRFTNLKLGRILIFSVIQVTCITYCEFIRQNERWRKSSTPLPLEKKKENPEDVHFNNLAIFQFYSNVKKHFWWIFKIISFKF